MSGIHLLRFGSSGGFKRRTSEFYVGDFDNGLNIGLVKAQVTFLNNGSVAGWTLRRNVFPQDSWWVPNVADAGDNLWVKAVRTGGNRSTEGCELDTIYRLDVNRVYWLSNQNGGLVQGLQTCSFVLNFYTNSGGTGTPVNTFPVQLECEWAV